MATNDHDVHIGSGYPLGQLASALLTATGHEDEQTRARASERLRRWVNVLRGMAAGTLTVGSRTPVAGMPVWVTSEVVRGGFATGAAAAAGPLGDDEIRLAAQVGVEASRAALFAYHLTEPGLARLSELLDSGAYWVDVPEASALLTVGWLLRAGDRDAALGLLETIGPYAGRLRFYPRPAEPSSFGSAVVWRETVGDVRAAVQRRAANPNIEVMREALTIWNPFADDLLTLWLDRGDNDRVDAAWRARGAALLERYAMLNATHRYCTKHRNPKGNIAILRTALQHTLAGTPVPPRTRGLLQPAIEAMLVRRGRPGTPAHSQLRERQRTESARPTHHELGVVVAARLSALRQDVGTPDPDALTGPAQTGEAAPDGAAIPDTLRRIVRRAAAGGVEDLITGGVVPSAEVLARLVPQIAASATAAAYRDDALRTVIAATYRAFRNRRSLLLVNLAHQATVAELPWVHGVETYRIRDTATADGATATLRRVGELAIGGFPGTVVPNPLVRELTALAAEAGTPLPWVDELAADIFESRFSAKFLDAAKIAGEFLTGSLYERYYGIDYTAIGAIDDVSRHSSRGAATSASFDALCQARTGALTTRRSVAANGMVIEQAQILTTHNLATLVHRVGITPIRDWSTVARAAYDRAAALAATLDRRPRPLPTIKDIAYAWRQMIFYASQPDVDAVTFARGLMAGAGILRPAVEGLVHVAAGGTVDNDGTAGNGRRLLGWSVERHWLDRRV
jgi:hypothetical protein